MSRENPESEAADLANPVWAALSGPQAKFARVHGDARVFDSTVSVFGGMPSAPDAKAWADLAALLGPTGATVLVGPRVDVPAGWEVVRTIVGFQFVEANVEGALDDDIRPLGEADAPEMLALAERTRPGPFLLGTVELGGYVGVRHEGRLVAMAGRRMRPAGWTEVSAVCTDDEFRGRGLAGRLVRAVVAGIHADGDRAFLHVENINTGAISLYRKLGFVQSREMSFVFVRPPR